MLLDGQSRVRVKRPQGLIAYVIGEEPRLAVAAFVDGMLLGYCRTQLNTRDRAVLGRVRVVQPVFLISQLSCAVQRIVLVVRRRHRPLQVVQRIRVVGGVVYAREIAIWRAITAVTADCAAVAVPEGVGYATRGTSQQQLLAAAAAFRKARLATGGLVRASCAGRVIEGGIFLGVDGWWKSRVANVHRMQRRVACQPKVIASDKVN